MAKKSGEPLTKVTLNLYASDYERLLQLYSSTGASSAIREVLRAHVAAVDAKIAALPRQELQVEIEV